SGKYAYVANQSDNSLRIIDISNPASPIIVGGVKDNTNLAGADSVYVSGKYAYVVNVSDDSLRIIDISSSTAPAIIGGVKDATNLNGARSVYVSGKYAYVASQDDNSLRIIDVSSSTNPSIIGGLKDNVNLIAPQSVYVSGKYAYVVNLGDHSLRIIDLGGIDAPSANIGSLQSNNISVTENLTVGNNAYITNGLNVGTAGIMTDGSLTAAGTTTLSGLVVSSSLVYMPALVAPGATSDYLCFDTGGKITHQAGNCTVSSQRFKHDIVSWNNGLSTILDLRPVTYKRNHDGVEELGLIAEEVDLVDKHLVIYEPSSTTPRSVDYARVVIPLISAIQEQQQQIDGLLLVGVAVNSSTPRTMSEEELLYAANRPLASALTYLINRLSDGASVIKDFMAERVTAVVGVFERVKTNEMEMIDSVTGDTYCIRIANGDWEKLPGSCDEQDGLTMPEPAVLGEVDAGGLDEEINDEPIVEPETEPVEEVTEPAPSFLDQLIDSVQEEIIDTEEAPQDPSDSASIETLP
ncbi:MAG TPA: tail fiber domain-containing protein, partial [Candidatus Magasanikbacteria bacterium]|nr:tail fiber domain-containing protein [Candidatus Magasanikbacteria bacterium]